MIVIEDTTPVNYLVLIQQADLLPRLFGQVLIPLAVFDELNDAETPVRAWLAQSPSWLQVQSLRSRPIQGWITWMPASGKPSHSLKSGRQISFCWMKSMPGRKPLAASCFIGTRGILRRAAQLILG